MIGRLGYGTPGLANLEIATIRPAERLRFLVSALPPAVRISLVGRSHGAAVAPSWEYRSATSRQGLEHRRLADGLLPVLVDPPGSRDHHLLEQTLMVRVEKFPILMDALFGAIRPLLSRFTLKTPGRPRKRLVPLLFRALAATPGPSTVTDTGPTREQLKTSLTSAYGGVAEAGEGAIPTAAMATPIANAPVMAERRTMRNMMILSR
ncbi:hypothetical protein ACWEPC_48805 [Nonomuraea sp. NPDC004297]